MQVRWVDGSKIGYDCETFAEVCKRLDDEGRLSAESVVEEATPEDSPIHGMFEWDDAKAAKKWRESQASKYIRSVEYVADDGKPVRYFQSVEPKRYVYTETVMGSEEMRAVILANAKRDLEAFTRKYSRLEELAEVVSAAKRAIQMI